MGRAVLGGGFRSFLGAQLAVEAFEQEMRREMTLEQSSELLCQKYFQFGFCGITFHLDDMQDRRGREEGWQAHINFGGRGYIDLWRPTGPLSQGPAAALFIDCIARAIDQKLQKDQSISRHESAQIQTSVNLPSVESIGASAATYANLPND